MLIASVCFFKEELHCTLQNFLLVTSLIFYALATDLSDSEVLRILEDRYIHSSRAGLYRSLHFHRASGYTHPHLINKTSMGALLLDCTSDLPEILE